MFHRLAPRRFRRSRRRLIGLGAGLATALAVVGLLLATLVCRVAGRLGRSDAGPGAARAIVTWPTRGG